MDEALAMYASMRTYRNVRRPAEVNRRVETGLGPLLRGMKGFHSYYLFHGRDGATAVSLFETEEAATASGRVATDWARENLADLYDGEMPEVVGAEVFVACDA